MRRVGACGGDDQGEFLAQIHYLHQAGESIHLPQVEAWAAYENNLWRNGATPYVDAIELIDYIPSSEEGMEE